MACDVLQETKIWGKEKSDIKLFIIEPDGRRTAREKLLKITRRYYSLLLEKLYMSIFFKI